MCITRIGASVSRAFDLSFELIYVSKGGNVEISEWKLDIKSEIEYDSIFEIYSRGKKYLKTKIREEYNVLRIG